MLEKDISNWLTKQIRQFIPVTDENAVNITAFFNYRKVCKGEFLLKEGQYGDWWGFVYQGLLRAYSCNVKEVEYTNGFFKEDSFTCELVSFSGAAVSQTSVIALEDSIIVCVNKSAVDSCFVIIPILKGLAGYYMKKF